MSGTINGANTARGASSTSNGASTISSSTNPSSPGTIPQGTTVGSASTTSGVSTTGTVQSTGTSATNILTVGAGQEYATIQAAVAAARSGDEIDIMAGTYVASDVTLTQNLTIKGVGGPVYIEAPGTLSYGGNVSKGIFVTGTTGNTPNITIEGLTFSGAQNADENAAGIRYQSGNLTLIDDTFTNNQDGILATPFIENTGTIIEQGVTLNHNGTEDGVAHNEYIGLINTFIMENSVSEDAIVGHEVKSRAFNNVIENNLIKDTATGTASYSIDLPDGGNAIIQGNTIEKGPNAQTAVMIHYGGEEQYNPGTLTITDDTFINDYTNPDALVTAVSNQSLNTNVTVSDNTFENKTPATILSGPGTVTANISATGTVLASSSNTLPTTTAMTTSFAGLSAAETFTFTKVNYTVVGGTGHLTVTNALMNDNVVGGSGGVTFTGATGVVYTAAGSANLLTITGGVGIESYGNDTINLEKGLSHVNVYGTATVNDSSTGTTDFYVSGNMTLHEDSNYYDTFKILTGGTVTVDGTAENQQVQDQGGTFNFNTGTNVGSYTGYFLGGSDNAKTVSLTAWQNSLMTNSVTLTAGNYSIALGGGRVDAHANSGAITMTNSGPTMSFIGGSGSTWINTQNGAAHIVMGTGVTTVTGLKTAPASTYEVDLGTSNGGTMTISDFKSGVDHLVMGQGVTISSETMVGASLHITASNHAQVILSGVHSL